MPAPVVILATGFFLACLTIQFWRLESLSATYDQALFLQELWSTAQGLSLIHISEPTRPY